jgi:hypothetical protein
VVLGQTIIINGDTVFDDSVTTQSLEGLLVDDVIEVSGFVNGAGEIVATYVEFNTPGGEYELVGIVSNLDSINLTFNIGTQSVEYSGATFEDFDTAVIANDDQVEVKGSTLDVNDALVAVKVELEEDDVAENDEMELEGLITDFESATEFRVFGIDVTITTATVFEGGTDVDLIQDVKVEVEGTVNALDILVANKVQFKAVEDTRFEAVVDSVVGNQVTVLGINFTITDTTQLEDDSELAADIFFKLIDLRDGDFVEIRGKLQQDGDGPVSVIATRLERDDPEDEVFVRGAVTSNNGEPLVIAGVSIVTTGETVYRDAQEMSIDQMAFFLALDTPAGEEVKAKGQKTGASEITATRLELEGDD